MNRERDWNKTIFLAHASEDKAFVHKLFDKLEAAGLEPWLDSRCLGLGMLWDKEISNAIKKARFFLACFSSKSVSKDGYIQREFRRALSELEEKPPGVVYFIPALIESGIDLPDITVETINLCDYQATDISTIQGQDDLIQYLLKQIGAVQKVKAKETPKYQDIRAHILNGQMDTAFRLLREKEAQTGFVNNDLILLMGRYNSVKSQNLQGVITNEQYTIQINQILYALLEMIKVMEER